MLQILRIYSQPRRLAYGDLKTWFITDCFCADCMWRRWRGGGGGGSDSTPPVTTAPVQTDNGNTDTTPETPVTAPETPATAPVSLTTGGTISGWTYTTPEGREYVMRGTGSLLVWCKPSDSPVTTIPRSPQRHGAVPYELHHLRTWTQYEKGQHGRLLHRDATLAANVPTQGTRPMWVTACVKINLSDARFDH
ncbi:Uncharacterised protein [Leclercia adecarboxylata]|uniref:Uncharacterized protein n=1 Tax=Leclercia adecarboxylata TaxID=83655 RepID=A0A4U9HYB0_9ENTR|nr:Uncharacterised protein [Leclercia adecarboxylata]